MARRCTTVPGFGFCCQAAQQGLLNRPVRMATKTGERCVECTTIERKNGRLGFQFRFERNAQCGIGSGGCPSLATAVARPSTVPAPAASTGPLGFSIRNPVYLNPSTRQVLGAALGTLAGEALGGPVGGAVGAAVGEQLGARMPSIGGPSLQLSFPTPPESEMLPIPAK